MTMSPDGSADVGAISERARRKVGWPGALAILLWLAAGVTLLAFGGFWSAVLWGIAGLMGWQPSFDAVQAQGKQTLSTSGRIAAGTIFTLLGLVLHPGWPSTPAPPPAPAEQARIDLKPTASQIAEWKKMELRNRAKIEELLAGVKTLDKEDVEGQLYFWKDITKRAPANASYAEAMRLVQAKVDELAPFREHPESATEVVKVVGRKAAMGTILLIDITLKNRSLSNLKDFEIECTSTAKSGTEIGRNSKVLYDTVDARETRTFHNVNMGFINPQAVHSNCIVMTAAVS